MYTNALSGSLVSLPLRRLAISLSARSPVPSPRRPQRPRAPPSSGRRRSCPFRWCSASGFARNSIACWLREQEVWHRRECGLNAASVHFHLYVSILLSLLISHPAETFPPPVTFSRLQNICRVPRLRPVASPRWLGCPPYSTPGPAANTFGSHSARGESGLAGRQILPKEGAQRQACPEKCCSSRSAEWCAKGIAGGLFGLAFCAKSVQSEEEEGVRGS
eukprot:857225-Rhodomonas_salina.6